MAAEVRLPTLALPGLSPDSLGNYLASLGLLRVLSRNWTRTRIAWLNGVLRVVGGPPTLDELLNELVRIADSRDWTRYNKKDEKKKEWSDAQKESTKAKSGTPLALWQAKAPESQLQLFAAHAVPHARVSFNPLLGSGGNAGRRDFAAGWKKAVEALANATREKKKDALRSWLLGQPVTWMVEKLNAGSWFSEATEIYNSGQKPSREAQQVPWAMVLACEGLVFFAGSASRRLGAKSARTVGAFPFITQPIAASAEKEADRLCGEVWTPLWSRPMSLAEVSMLFSRGRAELRGRGALTPAEFATVIRKRGVDAGVSEFRRFTLGRTTSSNTFESRLEVRFSLSGDAGRAGEAVATTLDCITALIEQRGFPRDGKRFVGLRGPIESALLGVASEPNRSEAGIALLDAVVRALDRIDRNRSFREAKVRWEPLPLEWLPSLFANEQPGVEARLALSLVSAFPPTLPFAAFRFGVQWTREQNGKYEYDWTTEPEQFEHSKVAPAHWVWGPGELARVLGSVLSRRLLEEAARDGTNTKRPQDRAPLPATTSQIRQWLTGELDESLFAAWLSRLALFDWRIIPKKVCMLIPKEDNTPRADGALALLGLFQPLIDWQPLIVRDLAPNDLLSKETGARTTEAARALVMLIRAGNIDAAVRLAGSRYAVAGAHLASFNVPFATHDPDRLAAALLFPLSTYDRTTLFTRWLRPRRQPKGEAHV
ncbi:MAG: type I-U CRISPR-associated protein Csx17 [Thermomicrobium sp.]|uniref:type I-G CRISPR-associated protein Cas8g1/Csx17 n=1 Tax=Thermomicrobium sp. TaxID=1969469 RepID=UPI001B16A3A7|nr:type I-U CRISPR-associated protein Csx17 [Thermomicrobium sp.]MBO9360440.1 type I-U CRISPR-associated protein Csx17 [Thermomicrobium sp.]